MRKPKDTKNRIRSKIYKPTWLIILLFSFQQISQAEILDSLIIESNKLKNNTEKKEYWQEKSVAYSDVKELCLRCLDQNLLYLNKNDSIENTRNIFLRAKCYEKNLDNGLAEYYYKSALSRLSSSDIKSLLLRIDVLIGFSSFLKEISKNDQAIHYLLEAASICKSTNDSERLGVIYHNIACEFNNMEQYNEAIPYFEKSIQARRQTKDYQGFALSFLSMAFCYRDSDLPKMEQFLDSASIYANKTNDPYVNALCTSYTGILMEKKGDNEKAIGKYNEAFHIAEKNKLLFVQFDILGLLYNNYFRQKQFDMCELYITRFYHLALKMNNKEQELQALKELSLLSSYKKNYEKAFHYLSDYVTVNDSFQIRNLQLRINQIEKEFNSKEALKEIDLLQKENLEKEKILNLNKWIYIFLGSVIILSLVTAYLFYSGKQYKQRLLLNETNRQKEIAIGQALLQGQQQERQRIARELHDGIGGMLSSVKYNLQSNDITLIDLKKTISYLNTSIEEVRRVSHDLSTSVLDRYSLTEAIANLCQQSKIKITFEPDDAVKKLNLPYIINITIYRIVQELITNAIKHAEATNIFVQFFYNEKLLLIVEDDGKGFEMNDTVYTKGIGMKNIRDRVSYLKGELNIQSTPSSGTCIYVEIPLKLDS